ncbi:hypothetical protein FORC81_1167 [Escherichia coli]|nr:hypothetical protein FORC81_1167 [Escherichia coli]
MPNWISVSLWREWVEFRQALRKPIRTEQGANGAIRELEKFRQQGFSPEQVIRHSIANEYQGLFAPKGVRPETLLRQVNTVSLPDSAIPPGFRGQAKNFCGNYAKWICWFLMKLAFSARRKTSRWC